MPRSPRLSAFAIAAAALVAAPAAAQLTPPAGAVAPTQATEIFTIPLTISAPGSYRLVRDLTAAGAGNMITVTAADVTIDLDGHTLNGGGAATNGIQIGPGGDRLRIVNDHITNVTASCIGANLQTITVENMTLSNAATQNGIAAANGKPCIVRNVTIHTVGLNGVAVSPGSIVENVTVTNATSRGFDCNGRTTFRSCTAVGCGIDGFIVGTIDGGAMLEACVADLNSGSGFVVGSGSVLRGCKANGNGAPALRGVSQPASDRPDGVNPAAAGGDVPHPFDGYVNAAQIDRRTGQEIAGLVNLPLVPRGRGLNTGADGIRAGAGSTIDSCAANDNVDDGIAAGEGSSVLNCSARGNDAAGISVGPNATTAGCTATANTATGIIAGVGCRVSDCTASANPGGGLIADDRATVEQCTASGNGGTGITADFNTTLTRCDAVNNAGATSDGIAASGNDAVVIGCTSKGNGQHGISILPGSGASVRDCYVSGNGGDGILIAGSFAVVVRNHLEIDALVNTGSNNRIGPLFTGTDLSLAGPWVNFDL